MELRLLIIAILTIAVVGLALTTRRWQRPVHRPVDISGRNFPEGFLVFTSTSCATCKDALARLKATGVPLREVTWELEPGLIEDLGIESVPLVVRVDQSGEAVGQVVGVPRQRWLRRMAR